MLIFVAVMLPSTILCFALAQPHRSIHQALHSLTAYKDWAETIYLLDWLKLAIGIIVLPFH
jgi:hypothetical protein